MVEPFYMLEKKSIEDVKIGRMTVEEYGFLCGLACLVNPHNGYYLGNFSSIANDFGLDADKAKYICDKFKKHGYIWFVTRQGLRNFPIFVIGLQMASGKGASPRVVTKEYIQSILKDSEVPVDFQKSRPSKSKEKTSPLTSSFSEVTYKDIENKGEGKESKTSRAVRPAPSEESRLETFQALKEEKGETYAKEYFQERGYEIPSEQ